MKKRHWISYGAAGTISLLQKPPNQWQFL